MLRRIALCLLWYSLILSTAWAETLTWNANTETDLAGYKVYQSTTSGTYGTPTATLGNVTTYNFTLPTLTVDQRYFFVITAYDLNGNESARSNEVSKLIAGVPPLSAVGMPVLTVGDVTDTTVTVVIPPVDDGTGQPAKIDLRYAVAPINWGAAASAVCLSFPCTIPGLTPDTSYQFQAVAYRGVLNTNAVFGPLSSIVAAVTQVAPDLPPTAPGGLQISSATAEEVVIVARTLECPRITTSTKGSTTMILKRTVRCMR